MLCVLRRGIWAMLWCVVWCLSLSSLAASEDNTGCKLRYPIVFSHNWSARKICPMPDRKGKYAGITSNSCEAREPRSHCAQWNEDESICVGGWRVPEDQAHLPPRNINLYDSSIVRDMTAYHRYYSKDVVDQLEACGNAVYLSDKPIFAGYAERARSLRNTVKQALAETGAEKVIIVGLSQGSQDARWMTAKLPFADGDPSQGLMRSRVAAVVSTAGEPQGAESASVSLALLYLAKKNVFTGEFAGWGNMENDPIFALADGAQAEAELNVLFWCEGAIQQVDQQGVLMLDELGQPLMAEREADQFRGRAVCHKDAVYHLLEQAGADAATEGFVARNLSLQQRYDASLRSLAVLSKRYMSGSSFLDWGWSDLRDYLGLADSWSEAVEIETEADNGVAYFSYAAAIQRWHWRAWDFGAEMFLFHIMGVLWGPNDGYVSVASQRFDTLGYDNFEHIATLKGSVLGRGYHHMFFTGRNLNYGPAASVLQQSAPYQGGAAEFYVQMARDLVARGF
jgi:pimeloyl-ACP methyl ester carboxylesterase